MENTIRAALVTLIKSRRQKIGRAERRRKIKPKRWLYPHANESRYGAAYRAWVRPMKAYVHNFLKENQSAILRGDTTDFHADSIDIIPVTRLDAVPGRSFSVMVNSLNGWLAQYVPDDDASVSASPIFMGLGKIADNVFDFNEGQFEKGAKSVLGVEFPVGENWWPDARENWAQFNYHTISGDMRKYVRDLNTIVERAVTTGQSVRDLTANIQALDKQISKTRANFIARDQIGKLNGEVTQRRMENIGLSMYIWETSGDEHVRGNPSGKYPDAHSSHYIMDGRLCRWDDSSVYSEDGGKTWKDRGSDVVQLHPGQDYQCRCTATAYWEELVGEADAQIDLISENQHNIPDTVYQGLEVKKPPSVDSRNLSVQEQEAAREAERRADNARKAKAAAEAEFQGVKFTKVEDGIYQTSPRSDEELRSARILRDLGSTIYFVPERSRQAGNKFDAIIDGLHYEFKNTSGNTSSLETHFLRSRAQAPNVFINLETSNLTRSEAMGALYSARNSVTRIGPDGRTILGYGDSNKFKGGRVILKLRGHENLIYLNVDDLVDR